MATAKAMIKNYAGNFKEGNEFSLGHVFLLCIVSAISFGVFF